MNKAILTTLAFVLLAPAVSAHHWEDDPDETWATIADSGCTSTYTPDAECAVGYACTGGAPPQVVDTVLYCAARASGKADDIALWTPAYAWAWLDSAAAVAEDMPGIAHDSTEGQVSDVNEVLCGQIWSFFCSNPLVVPEHIPVDDPTDANPPVL